MTTCTVHACVLCNSVLLITQAKVFFLAWQEETQFENKEHIAEMKLAMERWKEEEEEIQSNNLTYRQP